MAQAADRLPKAGGLVAIGVGPGDPELITLKGVRLLREADVIMTPVGDRSESSVAHSIIAGHLEPGRQQVLLRVFPMRQPAAQMADAWRAIAAELAILVREGKRVAFVTLGDPMLYSTFLYLRHELLEHYPDIGVSTVPGISSILAAANRAQLPLGLGDEIVSIIPATLADDRLAAALATGGTVVLLKVYRAFARIRALLQKHDLEDQAVYVRRLGLEGEKVVRRLADVDEADLDYLSLILVRHGVDNV